MSGSTPITGHEARYAPGGRLISWVLPEALEMAPLGRDLAQAFKAKKEKDLEGSRTWYDTDDWRLYRKDLLLYHERSTWNLVQRATGEAVAACSGEDAGQFRFARDFPVSRLRMLLEPVLTVRTLLPLFAQDTRTTCLRILNRERKTVAFVYLDLHRERESGGVFRTVTVKGVRGYDGDFAEVCRFFAAYGVNEAIPFSAPLDRGVKERGREPLDYSSKFEVALPPDMPARRAMREIYRQLLAVMEHNVDGIIQDLDAEFLHDFRVAVRRTRSGLGQVRDVLPPEVVQQAKRYFSWLGRITGVARDLDVYLLEREKYLHRLPEELRPFLHHFFADIEKRREKERKKLAAKLHSAKFRQGLVHWHEYLLGEGDGSQTANAGRPVIELAREIISGRYSRVLKEGKGAGSASSPAELHRLRIQCKKLRYTMEFFTSLFQAESMKLAIRQLKQLQDTLGTLNDLAVQQKMLQGYLSGLRPGSRKNQELAAAIGGLLTRLHEEQQEAHTIFESRFSGFSGEENRRLYTGLFHRQDD